MFVLVCGLQPDQGDLGSRFGKETVLKEAENWHRVYVAWRRLLHSCNYHAKEDAMLRKLICIQFVCVCMLIGIETGGQKKVSSFITVHLGF